MHNSINLLYLKVLLRLFVKKEGYFPNRDDHVDIKANIPVNDVTRNFDSYNVWL